MVIDIVYGVVVSYHESREWAEVAVGSEPEWVAWRLRVRESFPPVAEVVPLSAASSSVKARGRKRLVPSSEAVA